MRTCGDSSCFVLSATCERKANTHLILLDTETWHQFVPVGEGPQAKFPKPSLLSASQPKLFFYSLCLPPLKTSGWDKLGKTHGLLSLQFDLWRVLEQGTLHLNWRVSSKQMTAVILSSSRWFSIWQTVVLNEPCRLTCDGPRECCAFILARSMVIKRVMDSFLHSSQLYGSSLMTKDLTENKTNPCCE